MTRIWLFLIPIAAGVTPAAAQLTPEQRQQREWSAVATTIGRTREIEADDRAQHDPLRGLRCAGDASQYYPCIGVRTANRYTGAPVAGNRRIAGNSPAATPAELPRVAFNELGHPAGRLRPLGVEAVTLHADRPTAMTLSTPIGGKDRAVMIRTVLSGSATSPEWARMREEVGDADGHYVIQVPAFPAGRYTLEVEVYDLAQPAVPASSSTVPVLIQ